MWHCDGTLIKLLSLKKGLLPIFLHLKQFTYWERSLCVHVLACEKRAIAFSAEVSARCFLWFPAASALPAVGALANGHHKCISILNSINLHKNVLGNKLTTLSHSNQDLEMLFILKSFITFEIVIFFHLKVLNTFFDGMTVKTSNFMDCINATLKS